MTRRRLWKPLAVVTATVVVLTACGGSPGDPAARAAERAPFAPGAYRAGDLERDVAALAGWGIPTFADTGATEPIVPVSGDPVPLRLLRSQVEILGREAAAGVGTRGADLDAVFSTAAGTNVKVSALLAAYLDSGSEVATTLRSRLTTVDLARPADAVFPTIVLTAFIRDVAVAPGPGGGSSPQSVPATQLRSALHSASAAAGPCTATTGWIENTLAALFEGLRIPAIDTSKWPTVLRPLGWLSNALISVYDAIRQGAQYVVIGGAKVLLEPIRSVLAQVALIAGVVQTALTSIHPLTSSWDGPGYPEFGVDGEEERRYETTLHVASTSPLKWPQALLDCAKAAGVTLPNPSLGGSKVRWEPTTDEPGVIRPGRSDEVLADENDGGKATFRFTTASEPREWKERGAARAVRTVVTAVVERKNKQLKDAADAAVEAALRELLSFLPGFLKQRASDLVRHAIDPALRELVIRSEYRAARVFGVTRHNKPEPTPTPTPTPASPEPTAPAPVWVYVDRPGIPGAVEKGRILQLVACDGLAGTWRGSLRTGGLYDDDGFQVPWAKLPVTPFRIGNGGIGSTTTRASGTVHVPLPNQNVPVSYNLAVTVDGKTMTVDGVPVQPPVSFRRIPIRPAPAGVCK